MQAWSRVYEDFPEHITYGDEQYHLDVISPFLLGSELDRVTQSLAGRASRSAVRGLLSAQPEIIRSQQLKWHDTGNHVVQQDLRSCLKTWCISMMDTGHGYLYASRGS